MFRPVSFDFLTLARPCSLFQNQTAPPERPRSVHPCTCIPPRRYALCRRFPQTIPKKLKSSAKCVIIYLINLFGRDKNALHNKKRYPRAFSRYLRCRAPLSAPWRKRIPLAMRRCVETLCTHTLSVHLLAKEQMLHRARKTVPYESQPRLCA